MTSLDQTVFDDPSGEPSPSGDHGGLDVEAATAANLLTALATRLRAAYEQGTDVAGLAAAAHRSESEVRLLLQRAGVEAPPDGRAPTGGSERSDSGKERAGAGRPSGRPAHDAQQTQPQQPQPPSQPRPVRRPTPSRRLSRLHPRAVPDPVGPSAPGESRPAQPDGRQPVPPLPAQTPMGILIGASPSYSEPPAQPEDRQPRRVPARIVKVGRGTTLVVLPSWRAAIAVSVPTDLLVRATGLSADQLAGAHLTVLMNPEALHDRELDLHDWQ
ncbi:hypothetical protein GCM10009760_58030 [Kitasatospora kazusensis]|uniref:Uncharacterized protein n=1 Tax=Kitasatospora kazusensis TaxID=407974 RepID=A0ABN3A9D5_9ACTN